MSFIKNVSNIPNTLQHFGKNVNIVQVVQNLFEEYILGL